MGGRADVVEPLDRRAVIERVAERAPNKELVEAAEAAIRVAADKVDVERL